MHAAQPNVVVIFSDDIGYNELGFTSTLTGTPTQFETPNLDTLAQQSVIARQGYATHSLCTPSRAGFLTGMYQHRFGMQDNAGESVSSTYGLPANVTLMPTYLKNLGYTTGMIGKWHLGFEDGVNRPPDKGFDEFYGFWGSGRDYFHDLREAYLVRRGDQNYENQYRMEGDPSKYDPVRGRYVTDAFGEEAVDFINRHANDDQPFFLYTAFNNTHVPFGAKQADLDRFSHIADPTKRTLAAMTYAYDRAVGEILGAIEDNGLADNTIVVVTNDNGGNPWNDNQPFAGSKGLQFEGAIRVPFLIRAPGLTPKVYNAPISTVDLLPTFVAAAGGDESTLQTDGVDLMPFLTGEVSGNPHEVLFWRNLNMFAVRKGDWKLGNMSGSQFALYNIAEDPSETNNLYSQRLDIVSQMLRDFTAWEVELPKPMAGSSSAVNEFDHFVLHSDSFSESWLAPGTWYQAGTTNVATLYPADSYANLILEFPVKNGGSYVASNFKWRSTLLTVMLNQLRFTGDFSDTTSQTGRSNGHPLLLVKSLDNQLPQIWLDATSSGTTASFTFHLDNELQLYDDLQIIGNGTQTFVISGSIRDYYEVEPTVTTPHNVIKTGTSQVTLTGNNTFGGTLTVNGGTVKVSGATAAINGAAGIIIGTGGTVRLDSGTIAASSLDNSAGGAFEFNGGRLQVAHVVGNLTNSGGTFAPGASPSLSTISGNFSNSVGVLQIELAPTGYDRLQIGGAANLGGTLAIELLNGLLPGIGQAFQILAAAEGVNGTFAGTDLPTLDGGKTWNLLYGAQAVILAVGPSGGLTAIPGDYNSNGTVDAGDYVVWRHALGTGSLIADGNGNGSVDTGDFGVWRANFGLSVSGGGGGLASSAHVPEPTTLSILLLVAILALLRRNLAR